MAGADTGDAVPMPRRTLLQEWQDHWRVGLAAFLALSFSLGSYMAATSMFILPLEKAFGWSRSEIAFAHNAGLLSAFLSPFFGRLIDRVGARRIMLVGSVLFALAFFGLGAMNGSLLLFYFLFAMIFVSGLATSGITCSRVVSEVFVHSRGFSLAAARSGMALSGAFLPAILYLVITHLGWRAGYMVEGMMVLLIVWPAIYFWIGRSGTRRNPQAARPLPTAAAPVRWGQLLREPKIWVLCLGASLGYAPASALMSQLQPLLIDKSIDPASAATLVGLAGVASFVGAIVTGSLVDRFWAPGVALIFACGSAAGCMLFAGNATMTGPVAAGAIMLIGLGLGAEIDVVAYMVARYFGVTSFSTIYGLTVFFLTFSGSLSSWLLGSAYDRFGNYDLALSVMAGAFLAAGLAYLMLGRYPSRPVE